MPISSPPPGPHWSAIRASSRVDAAGPKLPIVDMCDDKVTLPIAGGPAVPAQSSPIKPAWQRWNDYGIGCFLEGGGKRGHFKQAEIAFKQLLALGEKDAVPHGHLNLARLYYEHAPLRTLTD